MSDPGALDRFAPHLDPAVIDDIRGWRDDPTLGPLYAGLNGHTSLRSFLDTWAEAIVARHLRARGCDLRFEVPTPRGRA